MKTEIFIKVAAVLFIVSILSIVTPGCIPTNPIGTPTDTNVYHKTPNWIVSDTGGKAGYPNLKEYDLNDDGINDFVITNIYPGNYGYFIADILVLNQTLVKGRAEQLNPDSTTVYSYYIPELPSGSTISLQDTFYNTNTTRYASLFVRNVTSMGNRTDTHLTGFKVMLNGQPHYAWVKFTETYTYNAFVTPSLFTGSVRINESGINKIPNTPIKAGIW